MQLKTPKRNILVLYYYYAPHPMRQSTYDHLYAFQDYGSDRYYFWNACYGLPHSLKNTSFDLILYHVTFCCSLLWAGQDYEACVHPFLALKSYPARKIMLTQDEFYRTERLSRFINDFDVWGVFSVAPPSEWHKIYRGIDFDKIHFWQVLTGYLNDHIMQIIGTLEKEHISRSIDIGYRAWKSEYWVGSHGLLKSQIADVFNARAGHFNLNMDISTKATDTFYGLDWYRFQMRCKYVIGVEGGSSILDHDGKVQESVHHYMNRHPQSTFEECANACFPGRDGELSLYAISPRHLESCALRTCQVLVEGDYNGILQPWVHYIPLKRDFSNLDEVLTLIKEDKLRESIVERAYNDIVASGKYNYRSFIDFVIDQACLDLPVKEKPFLTHISHTWHQIKDASVRRMVPWDANWRPKIKKLIKK